jgi:serine/threonine protein kinase
MIQFTGYKFYGDSVLWLSPPIGPSRATEGKGRRKMLGFSIGGAVLVVVLVGLVVIWGREVIKPGYKKQLPGQYNKSSELSTAISKSKLHYKFQTLRTATKNFNLANKIGEGGFGSVYKGILPDGTEIAVKRLFSNREQSVNEFLNEVNLISHVQHKNLIKLLGCSVDRPEKLLVYEYLPNKSLDLFLFDENMGNVLDWQRRFEIIIGTASGLAYLHQESDIRIIHRDIKSSNILLDHNFKPKIADFGLVRYFAEDQTHISTRIVGTRGYMAPEYLVHGHLTEKVDVYGFGVLVLEIISGIKNTSPMHSYDIPSLLTMVWNNYLLGTISKIIDPNIQEKYLEEVLQVVHIALLCTQASATLRPSMSKVITVLTSKEPNLLKPTQPPFIHGIDSQSNTSATYNHSQSNTCTSLSPTSQIHQPYQTPLSPLPL